jgi:hypothetical protein
MLVQRAAMLPVLVNASPDMTPEEQRAAEAAVEKTFELQESLLLHSVSSFHGTHITTEIRKSGAGLLDMHVGYSMFHVLAAVPPSSSVCGFAWYPGKLAGFRGHGRAHDTDTLWCCGTWVIKSVHVWTAATGASTVSTCLGAQRGPWLSPVHTYVVMQWPCRT